MPYMTSQDIIGLIVLSVVIICLAILFLYGVFTLTVGLVTRLMERAPLLKKGARVEVRDEGSLLYGCRGEVTSYVISPPLLTPYCSPEIAPLTTDDDRAVWVRLDTTARGNAMVEPTSRLFLVGDLALVEVDDEL